MTSYPTCQSGRVETKILVWLRKHPEVTRFAVIDDDDDELDDLPLFQPSGSTGLTQKIANGVAKYLQGNRSRHASQSRRPLVAKLALNAEGASGLKQISIRKLVQDVFSSDLPELPGTFDLAYRAGGHLFGTSYRRNKAT
jgi:hypothetical protein